MFFSKFSKFILYSFFLTLVTNSFAETFLKRKVAVARFTNETQSGTTFLVDDSGDRIGKQASDILSSRLAATGKFLMFERTDKDENAGINAMALTREINVILTVNLFLGVFPAKHRSTNFSC